MSCESGASKASGKDSERVGPNKITNEPWGKSIKQWVPLSLLTCVQFLFRQVGWHLSIYRNAGEGSAGASAPPALFKGEGGKSAFVMEQYISL